MDVVNVAPVDGPIAPVKEPFVSWRVYPDGLGRYSH